MNGADAILRTARAAGLEVCFANPGTTEMHLVDALDRVPGMRAVLGLFEGVCTGAADGYARMSGKPALTLLHLGPGLANGLANLHNARRAGSPVVNLIGDHATWHAAADAPLTSDIAALARAVGWVRTAQTARGAAADLAATIEAALSPPGQVATLILPQDCTWDDADEAPPPVAPSPPSKVSERTVETVASALRTRSAPVLLLGGRALRERGLRAGARIATATSSRIFHETFFARLEHGRGVPAIPRFPYFPEQGVEALLGADTVVLAGMREPVSFFGYRAGTSRLAPKGAEVLTLASPHDDVETALEALAEAVGAGPWRPPSEAPLSPILPSGALTPESLCAAIAALQPAGAIVVDESATSGLSYLALAAGAPAHTVLTLTGGAIGQGLPCALGAAVACPDRKVIAFQADGSGMYTLQALWTIARESLDVAIVVCANRRYRILELELARADAVTPGRQALSLTDLSHPDLDWVALARGLGVEARRATTADEIVTALAHAFARRGPCLIEAAL